jgi:hypothetical protein
MKPRAQTDTRMHTLVNATRWMHVSDSREVRHIPAEPIHICARSDDWEVRRNLSCSNLNPNITYVVSMHECMCIHRCMYRILHLQLFFLIQGVIVSFAPMYVFMYIFVYVWLYLCMKKAEFTRIELGRKNFIYHPYSLPWFQGLNSSMKITFRSAHIREKDKQSSLQKLFIHVLLLSAVSSVW